MSESGVNEQLFRDFDLIEAKTFLDVFKRADEDSQKIYRSFRDLFSGLGPHSTTLNRLTGFLGALLPSTIPGIPTPPGDRLKLLFDDSTGALRPTDLARTIYNRLRVLSKFINNLGNEVVQHITRRKAASQLVRIGAPPTLAIRLLGYVYSYPRAPVLPGQETPTSPPDQMSLQVTTGDTRERLMPRLLLDQMDAVIGYGLPTAEDKPIYRDPDLPGVSFRSLRRTVKMVLIYHPQSPPKFFSSREPSPGNPINPRSINLRETTFISVASWRQTEAIQDLMDQADRFGRLHTVRTYDEALAIVRMGSGFAFVPEMLIGRRIVTTCPLTPESAFQRELGVYYRNSPIDDSPQSPVVRAGACQFLEFFSHYLGDPLCDLRTPPAFNSDIRGELGGRSYDPADTPEKKYWNIVLSFQQKWRGMNNADWEDFSLKQYPPDDKSDRFEYTPPPLSE